LEELQRAFNDSKTLLDLMQEPPGIQQQRDKLEASINRLKTAAQELQQVIYM